MKVENAEQYIKCDCGADCDLLSSGECEGGVTVMGYDRGWIHRCAKHDKEYWAELIALYDKRDEQKG